MKKVLCVLVFLFCALLINQAVADNYTVSFISSDGVYLMQIDNFGHVTHAPSLIADDDEGCSSKTALADAGEQLFAYYKTEEQLWLIRVNKSTLAGGKPIRLPYVMETNRGGFLSATETPFFLGVGLENEILKGLPIDPLNGKPNGRTWRLSPRTEGSLLAGGVASDGQAAWAIASDKPDHTTLYVQALKSNGRPVAPLKAYITREEIQQADLTNTLPGNRKFLAYRRFSGPFDATNTTSELWVQPIDATTLEKVAGRKTIDNSPYDCITGGLVAEDQGKFLVYARRDFSCDSDVLIFQALDANGNASGPRIQLTECGDGHDVGGLDLIRN